MTLIQCFTLSFLRFVEWIKRSMQRKQTHPCLWRLIWDFDNMWRSRMLGSSSLMFTEFWINDYHWTINKAKWHLCKVYQVYFCLMIYSLPHQLFCVGYTSLSRKVDLDSEGQCRVQIITPPRNRVGIISSLQFVCLSVYHWKELKPNGGIDFDAILGKWLLIALV